jgi:hypothetical protein
VLFIIRIVAGVICMPDVASKVMQGWSGREMIHGFSDVSVGVSGAATAVLQVWLAVRLLNVHLGVDRWSWRSSSHFLRYLKQLLRFSGVGRWFP